MSATNFDFLYDESEDTITRFVCFVGETLQRFDLAITSTNRFFGKKLVIDIQSGRSAIIGPDDLEDTGYLEHIFKLEEDQAEELRTFLIEVVGMVQFTDI